MSDLFINIVILLYFGAIGAILVLRSKHQNLEMDLSFVKGLSFTIAKSQDVYQDELWHHFQVGFAFVMITLAWKDDE